MILGLLLWAGLLAGLMPAQGKIAGPDWERLVSVNSGAGNLGSPQTFTVNDRNQATSVAGQTHTCDANGNLTSGGGRSFSYNAENQLVSVSGGTSYRHDFVYDGLGRLRRRIDSYWNGSGWTAAAEMRYIYDGRRVIQERLGSNDPSVTYTRGLDLSGSLEGAGGIGGMLARSHGYSSSTGSWSTHHFYHADAGGNITALVDASQFISATYRYDSFGNLLSSSGGMAASNRYRFSSKHWWGNPGLYYYGLRFYDPNLQRWINRDPIGELGGINLYGFVGNDPLNLIDPDGRAVFLLPVVVGGAKAVGGAKGISVAASAAVNLWIYTLWKGDNPRPQRPQGCDPVPPDPQEWMGPHNSWYRNFRNAEDDCEAELEKMEEKTGTMTQEEKERFMELCMEGRGFPAYGKGIIRPVR
jgi:RHS repeat-associated protein